MPLTGLRVCEASTDGVRTVPFRRGQAKQLSNPQDGVGVVVAVVVTVMVVVSVVRVGMGSVSLLGLVLARVVELWVG